MAYKRYFYKNKKKFGPYYYESYRDENGKVKKRYIGTKNPDIKLTLDKKLVTPTKNDKLILIFLVFALFLMDLMVFFFIR
ncbi:hypothetical protein GOV12_04685 [Candidatus Pacearchaeota archaeon]|nr:hypothetical protein [Candidatus Pacearchaeota archaeon]